MREETDMRSTSRLGARSGFWVAVWLTIVVSGGPGGVARASGQNDEDEGEGDDEGDDDEGPTRAPRRLTFALADGNQIAGFYYTPGALLARELSDRPLLVMIHGASCRAFCTPRRCV